jgi:diguanylate cyclase
MDSLAYIVPWVLASVGVGVVVGYAMSRSRGRLHESALAEHERQGTLKTLVELLSAVEQISGEVETHNSEIRQTARDVGNLKVGGELKSVKRALLDHMIGVLSSNKRLQNDLLSACYRMEEQAQEIDHVRREARTDPLTAVANRMAFEEKLHVLLTAWHRQRQPFALLMLDLDHLKRINDSHGHQAGDLALGKLGGWLKQWLREGDFVARYGGDEFAVLLPGTDLPAGVELAERIRTRTADQASRIAFRGEQVSFSLSVGATVCGESDTAVSIIGRADEALYRAKRRGRNQVQSDEPPPPDFLATTLPSVAPTFGDISPDQAPITSP